MMAKLPLVGASVPVLDARTCMPAPKRADAELSTAAHRQWRKAVLTRAGFRCEAVEDGKRCQRHGPVDRLFADHIVERRDGGAALDPANGQCLCGRHHTDKTIAARARRMAARPA